jgi:hypothetical protein
MESTEIVVAVEPDPGPLSGAVCVGESPDRPFDGWLGLLSALQAAIAELTGDE